MADVDLQQFAIPAAETDPVACCPAHASCTPEPDGLVHHHGDRGGAYVSFDFCIAADLAGL